MEDELVQHFQKDSMPDEETSNALESAGGITWREDQGGRWKKMYSANHQRRMEERKTKCTQVSSRIKKRTRRRMD